MKKECDNRQLYTQLLIFKYTCTVCIYSMSYENIHAQKRDVIFSHMYAVYSTQHWFMWLHRNMHVRICDRPREKVV